jgi:hypothetical protein
MVRRNGKRGYENLYPKYKNSGCKAKLTERIPEP